MSPRDMLKAKARRYRESLELKTVTLMESEFKHLLKLLEDAADELESYHSSEEFSHEIRETLKKIKEGAR